MLKLPLRLALAVLAVSLALATPLHGATFQGSAPIRASRTSPAPGFWDWVTGLWGKIGCSLDPGGLCAPGANPPGHPVDPAAASTTDAGCGIDPGGRTCVGPS